MLPPVHPRHEPARPPRGPGGRPGAAPTAHGRRRPGDPRRRRPDPRGTPPTALRPPAANTTRRRRQSVGEWAWQVDIDPVCPVDSAHNMSSDSAPRTSPTTMRSGRSRSAARTSSRIATRPTPSAVPGRASRRTTCSPGSRSSATSSMVTIRSDAGTSPTRALTSDVLPDPVGPYTTMLRRSTTASRSDATTAAPPNDSSG